MTNEIKVLDKGFVRLVDVMGDDAAIVQAARVSYGNGTKSTREDAELINYLVRNAHTSPLEMVEFKFHCKMPIFIARQWIRHRTANVNEYSARYSEMKDERYLPELENIKGQSSTNKQGSDGNLEGFTQNGAKSLIEWSGKESFDVYTSLLENGVSREMARVVLPLNTYTEWYWKIDLHNLLHFLRLRLDSHAQWEIRQYAEAIAHFVKEKCPLAWAAFETYKLNSLTFSGKEVQYMKDTASADVPDEAPENFSKGEWKEFKEKLKRVGS
jgi:thymidylate synthase (FAD)